MTLKQLWNRIRSLWGSAARTRQAPADTVELPPKSHNRPRPPKPTRLDDIASHYYFDNLLEDLDHYFGVLKIMRKHDRDAYAFYRRVGALIAHNDFREDPADLPASWRDGSDRPARGMMHLNNTDIEKKRKNYLYPVFMSFSKIKQPCHVENAFGDDIFECSLYYRNHQLRHGKIASVIYYLAVASDGLVRQLKQQAIYSYDLPPSKRRILVSSRFGHVRRYEWRLPSWPVSKPFTAVGTFRYVASCVETLGADGFQVRVRKEEVVARFNIDLLRTPYFFKDRDKTVTVNGTVKRIFHIVRAHARDLANGRRVWVKSHFRGERRFGWLGYAVVISMPGYHHLALDDFTIEATIDAPKVDEETGMDGAMVGSLLDQLLDGDGLRTQNYDQVKATAEGERGKW